MGTTTDRWAIVGAGGIARQFATDLAALGDGSLVAVGSRDADRGAAAAEEMGAVRGHGSYDAAVADDVDHVYVATNHHLHAHCTHLAIEEGRHVLVEKPAAMTRAEAAEMFDHGRDRGVLTMEAMWTRFLPVVDEARAAIEGGVIGTVRRASAELGRDQRTGPSRILDADRAGGALLDMGVYPISILHMLLGPADEVLSAHGRLADGVDVHTEVVTSHGGVEAVARTAALEDLPSEVVVEGDRGTLVIPDPPHHPQWFELRVGEDVRRVDAPFEGHGFEYEIAAFHRHAAAGDVEVPAWSHADTLATHAVMDEARRRIGLVYPFEDGPPPA